MAAAKSKKPPKTKSVPEPLRSNEYAIFYGDEKAARGWRDLKATIPGPLTTVHAFLTRSPQSVTPTNYKLKAELSTWRGPDGRVHDVWQHKPTAQGTARIWFYVDGRMVVLLKVFTAHPNATK